MMEVYCEGMARDEEWLRQAHGVTVERVLSTDLGEGRSSPAPTGLGERRFECRVVIDGGPSLVSVYDEVGEIGPVEGAVCVLHGRDQVGMWMDRTDANGHCNVELLPPGRYNVWILDDEYASDVVRDVDLPAWRSIYYLTGRPAEAPVPEPEEPEEEPMSGEIKVVDLEYKEQDFEYAEEKYGVAFRRADVKPGQKVYRLIELWEKSGNSSLITLVLGEEGQPMEGVDVALYWPDAPEPPDPPTEVTEHDWYVKFVHGPTDADGDVGPGMGPGAYHGRGEGGPHAVWIRDPDIPSDICEKLGMLAGEFHDHLDQRFQLMTVEGDEPEPQPGPGPGEGTFAPVGEPEFESGPENEIRIEVLGEVGLWETRWSIQVVNINGQEGLFWEAGPYHPTDWDYIETGATYDPGPEEQVRTFAITIEDTVGKILGGPYRFPFNRDEHGVWTLQVKFIEPGGEEPPPEPSGPVSELFEALAEASEEQGRIFRELAGLLRED